MMSLITDIKIALHELVYSSEYRMQELLNSIQAYALPVIGNITLKHNSMDIIISDQASYETSQYWSDAISYAGIRPIAKKYSSEIYNNIKNKYTERGMVAPSKEEVLKYCLDYAHHLFHMTRTNDDLIVHL